MTDVDTLVTPFSAVLAERYTHADDYHHLDCSAIPYGSHARSSACDCGEPARIRREVEFLQWSMSAHEPQMLAHQVMNSSTGQWEEHNDQGCSLCSDNAYGEFYAWPCMEYQRANGIFNGSEVSS